MRAAVLETHRTPLILKDVPDPEPGEGDVLIRVEACGICSGDVSLTEGDWVPLPRIIGHEVVGRVERLGPGVTSRTVGERVGAGWLHDSCRKCPQCAAARPMLCQDGLVPTGIAADGGYAELMTAPADFVAPVPDGLDPAVAAPLTCAGLTVFVGLRRANLQPGARVAVVGIGGLGHLAIQYARSLGASVIAVSRNEAKRDDALRFGADDFLVAGSGDLGSRLREAGGADVALVTASESGASGQVLAGLRPEGTLVVLGFGAPLAVSPDDLCMKNLRVVGSLVGNPDDLGDALRWAAEHDIRPQIECFPLEEANEALATVREGTARYRAVIVP